MNNKQKEDVKKRLKKFLVDPYSQDLNNHGLQGKYKNYRSINISGDVRAIYKMSDDSDEAVFVLLGNHNNLYS